MFEDCREDGITREEYNRILKLAPYLGGSVNTPEGIRELTSINFYGYVECFNREMSSLETKEFHVLLVTPKDLPILFKR
ncbi:hypothetical protein LCGC14_2181240 [marine sediment metagenome]|uniref:Uncharacterized protein n=1 Tax=marine sediment metagenome TaxID=412755 RepID=A0A0F9DM91_9ZZZZ